MTAPADAPLRYVAHAADGTRVAIEVRREDCAEGPLWIASWVIDADGTLDKQHGESSTEALAYALAEISYDAGRPLVEVLRDGEAPRRELLAALRELADAAVEYGASVASGNVRPDRTLVALNKARRLLAATEVRP